MLLANARSDVMFAHYAVRRNIIHAVNITAEGNITCPQGQTSFSVNAPLRASRYARSPFLFYSTIASIASSSSLVKAVLSVIFRFSRICSGFDAPIRTLVIPSFA